MIQTDDRNIFSFVELVELTGYEQASRQLEELHERGFWRARIRRDGRVVLERPHYEAVCAGATPAPVPTSAQNERPRLKRDRAAA